MMNGIVMKNVKRYMKDGLNDIYNVSGEDRDVFYAYDNVRFVVEEYVLIE